MKTHFQNNLRQRFFALVPLVYTLLLLCGCKRSANAPIQGYIEGEFVYVASPLPGSLKTLMVQKGGQVKSNDALFALENISETASMNEAQARLAQARANLEDARKARRPSEIEALKAQLEESQAALELAENEWVRQGKLSAAGAGIASDLDRARSSREQSANRVKSLEAQISTANLGARSDQIDAAMEEVRSREAALAGSAWNLSQKSQTAPQAGFVFDTLYREGEWVAAGRPVVVLLPPQNIKLRCFVPERRVGAIHAGDRLRVSVDGAHEPLAARVSYVSPQVEYTPPVIYSKENRAKLMFMVEAVFEPSDAATLHPGQPVDVEFAK